MALRHARWNSRSCISGKRAPIRSHTCRHVFKGPRRKQPHLSSGGSYARNTYLSRLPSWCLAIRLPPVAAAIDNGRAPTAPNRISRERFPASFSTKKRLCVFDDDTISSSAPGDKLLLCGALKEKTFIDPPSITIGYCRLELTDDGATCDPILRKAAAQDAVQSCCPTFPDAAWPRADPPVFNLTRNGLCGMVALRGTGA